MGQAKLRLPKIKTDIRFAAATKYAAGRRLLISIDGAMASSGITVIDVDTEELLLLGKIITTSIPKVNHDDYRLFGLAKQIEYIANMYKATESVMEDQYGGMNASTSLKLSKARASIAMILMNTGISSTYISPAGVKHKVVPGHKLGTISKEMVADAVIKRYPGYEQLVGPFSESGGQAKKTDDIYDSTAIGMARIIDIKSRS